MNDQQRDMLTWLKKHFGGGDAIRKIVCLRKEHTQSLAEAVERLFELSIYSIEEETE